MRKKPNKLFIGIAVLCLLILLFNGVMWFSMWFEGSAADPLIIESLKGEENFTVYKTNNMLVFHPLQEMSDTGFIFYPGARVDYRVYAPLLREIAKSGYMCVLIKAPLNMAFFSPDRASEAMKLFPQVKAWVVGGHSLGGIVAARYASLHLQEVQGLVLWASPMSVDFTQNRLPILVMRGTKDALIDRNTFLEADKKLPKHARLIEIEGGNHANFGAYTSWKKDDVAAITAKEQREIIIKNTVVFLDDLKPDGRLESPEQPETLNGE